MAQTWPVSRRRRAILGLIDGVGRALFAPLRRVRKPTHDTNIQRILVIEPWNIGDVVLATPILAALRSRWPEAHIAVLAKSYARDLLEGSGLVDEVIVADLPWTAQQNKYRLTRPTARELRGLIGRLRIEKFDLTVDARMDIRSNLLAAATGAERRVGYDVGGGGWLLTDSLPSDRGGTHRVEDWLALLSLLGVSGQPAGAERSTPCLAVSSGERSGAAQSLNAAAGNGRPTIGYHPGGSHPGKRWPRERFKSLVNEQLGSLGGRHIVFLGPADEDDGCWPAGATVMRPSLRELMALLTWCDVLVCNDSGPMHIADALGVPVVAVFEVGNPEWFGPSGPRATVIAGENAGIGVSAAPLDNPPSNPVAISRVAEAVRTTLATRDEPLHHAPHDRRFGCRSLSHPSANDE